MGSLPPLLGAPYLATAWPAVPGLVRQSASSQRSLRVTSMDVVVVKTPILRFNDLDGQGTPRRTSWIFVRLHTNRGLTGLGEASLGSRTDLPELTDAFELVREESPFDIEQYRRRGWNRARSGGRSMVAAFNALEQAQWDLVGRALDAPVYDLFGGKLRNELSVYANINRLTVDRSPAGLAAAARRAVEEGFGAIKAGPFDGFPSPSAARAEVERAIELGIACVEAMRAAIGPDVKLKIDCHSVFNRALSIDVARRLEPQKLSWYEEPVAPEQLEDTKAIHAAIPQRLAGGEAFFGAEGFAPLCQERAVDVIMPDVRFCGGILKGRRIATVAGLHGVAVAPHNPSGPVATAASVQLCAGMANFDILEYQLNEVPWRGDLLDPPEQFLRGTIAVPDGPGLGMELNEPVVRAHV